MRFNGESDVPKKKAEPGTISIRLLAANTSATDR
jgi:hypothetical protein